MGEPIKLIVKKRACRKDGTSKEYLAHKQRIFPAADLEFPIAENEAFY